MNWKLIFGLSLFGLLMAFATITLIPSSIEIYIWVPVFLICAWIIAQKAPGKFFLHGFLVSLVNCVWITGAHVFMSSLYLSHHADEASQYAAMQKSFMQGGHGISLSVRRAMLIFGPVIGIISGLVLGLFSFIASKISKKRPS